jgi:hypothetical protein
MEVYLDGARQLTLQLGVSTVGAALVELNGWLQQNGRALQSVSIDGTNIPADQLTQEIGNLPASNVSRLDVASARVVDLVVEALDEAQGVLPEMPVACQTLAQILGGENPNEGIESLNQVLEIWTALRERRRQIAEALTLDFSSLSLSGRSLAERDLALTETLNRVYAARDQADFAALADLVAYDLFEFAEQELEVFGVLRAQCETEA